MQETGVVSNFKYAQQELQMQLCGVMSALVRSCRCWCGLTLEDFLDVNSLLLMISCAGWNMYATLQLLYLDLKVE